MRRRGPPAKRAWDINFCSLPSAFARLAGQRNLSPFTAMHGLVSTPTQHAYGTYICTPGNSPNHRLACGLVCQMGPHPQSEPGKGSCAKKIADDFSTNSRRGRRRTPGRIQSSVPSPGGRGDVLSELAGRTGREPSELFLRWPDRCGQRPPN